MDWLIWRPVTNGWATLREVQTQWSIDDLLDAQDIDFALARAHSQDRR